MNFPLVSIITPTTENRAGFHDRLISIVAEQDYPRIEHLLDYDGGNIGQKRNRLCEKAKGDIIIHIDDDDIYASDWVTKSVFALLSNPCDITGLAAANFRDIRGEVWQYTYPTNTGLHGATMCYKRSFWEQHPFLSMQVGEDSQFTRGCNIFAHDYVDGFTATIHANNTSPKNVKGDRWRKVI